MSSAIERFFFTSFVGGGDQFRTLNIIYQVRPAKETTYTTTDRDRYRETERQRDREIHREIERQRDRETER